MTDFADGIRQELQTIKFLFKNFQSQEAQIQELKKSDKFEDKKKVIAHFKRRDRLLKEVKRHVSAIDDLHIEVKKLLRGNTHAS